jgi:hypothetical protein
LMFYINYAECYWKARFVYRKVLNLLMVELWDDQMDVKHMTPYRDLLLSIDR